MPSTIHWPGTVWHNVRSRACGSIIGSEKSIVCCQNDPPTTVVRPGVRTPIPSRPSWVSAPPATTGVPAGMPVSAAAAAVTAPITVPDSRTGGNRSGSSSSSSRIAGDQVRVARSNIPELEPSDGSVANSPVSRVHSQSPSMPTWAARANTSGARSAIQRNRAGAVIATQSPARA